MEGQSRINRRVAFAYSAILNDACSRRRLALRLFPMFIAGAANSEPWKVNRRLVAITLTIAFHAVWLAALLDRSTDRQRPLNEGHSQASITLLPIDHTDVDRSSGQHSIPLAKSDAESVPKSVASSETEVEPDTAQIAADLPPTVGTASSSQQNASAGEIYDPYAGTAPMRRSDPAVPLALTPSTEITPQFPPPSASSQLFELEAGAFEALKRKIKEALSATKGSVDLRVRVSRDGTVVGATLLSSDMPAADAQKVLAIVTGQALFIVLDPSATEATVDLPSIKLRRGWHLFG